MLSLLPILQGLAAPQGQGRRWHSCLWVLFSLLLVWVTMWFPLAPAWAAEDSGEATPPPTTTVIPEVNSADIPSEKVTQFVSAYLQVVELIDARSEDLERAQTEAESFQIQQGIQQEAYQVIEATGLTRQDYWQLLGLANTDAEFRDRVLAQLDERD